MDYIAQALTIETHNINESPLKKKKQIGPKKEKIRYFYGTLGTAYKNHDISESLISQIKCIGSFGLALHNIT